MPSWALLTSIDQGKSLPGFKRYFLRRAARILPAYYVALIILVGIGNLWRAPGAHFDILLHSIFLFNFTDFAIMSINPPFWTLAVEVQLYFVLPLLFLIIQRLSIRQGILFIICLALGSYMLHYWLNRSITQVVVWPFQPWLTWIRPYGAVLSQSPLALLPHFLVGLLTGRFYIAFQAVAPEKLERRRRLCQITVYLSLTAILILLSTRPGDLLQLPYGRYGLPVVMVLLAALVLTVPMSGLAKSVLEGIPLRWLGLVSYGFYIYHYPCLHWCDRIMNGMGFDAQQHWLWFGMLSLLVSILSAAFSYYLIERPVLELLRKRNTI